MWIQYIIYERMGQSGIDLTHDVVNEGDLVTSDDSFLDQKSKKTPSEI